MSGGGKGWGYPYGTAAAEEATSCQALGKFLEMLRAKQLISPKTQKCTVIASHVQGLLKPCSWHALMCHLASLIIVLQEKGLEGLQVLICNTPSRAK